MVELPERGMRILHYLFLSDVNRAGKEYASQIKGPLPTDPVKVRVNTNGYRSLGYIPDKNRVYTVNIR